LGHSFWKLSLIKGIAARAEAGKSLILGYFELGGRQIKDLTFLFANDLSVLKAITAGGAGRGCHYVCVIRVVHQFQSVTGMPWLPASAPICLLTQIERLLWLLETIAGRGLVAVVTVLRQAGFQLLDTCN
jgi:hypothetical protein